MFPLNPHPSGMHTPELSYRVVAIVYRLPSLLAHDAHADVCSLDHGHIVGTVADGQHLALKQLWRECDGARGNEGLDLK